MCLYVSICFIGVPETAVSDDSKDYTVLIVLLCVFGFLIIIVILIIVLCYFRYKKKKKAKGREKKMLVSGRVFHFNPFPYTDAFRRLYKSIDVF